MKKRKSNSALRPSGAKLQRMRRKMVSESVRRAQARLRRELYLGRGKHTGRLYHLKPEEYLATHTHIIGASNFGKSFYLEHLLRAYTTLRFPASLIDPHGDLAEHYYQWLMQHPRANRGKRVVYFKPGLNTTSFNPFQWNLEPGVIAALMLEAFMKVWGQDSFNQTPLLERILHVMFHAFAANHVPLTESHQFLLVENRAFRQALLGNVANGRVREDFENIELYPKGEKLIRFESARNRIQRFFVEPAVEQIFSGQGKSLDFADLFWRGDSFIGNLELIHSTAAQELVGTILVNGAYHAAKRRPRGQRQPWILAIDEFPQFVTTDVARHLDELRKFGIRLILANQRLAQLPEDLLSAVMTNARIKAVFGGLSRLDAEILARELFTGDVTGGRTKYVSRQTKFRPVLEEREIETLTEGEIDGEVDTEGWTDQSSSHWDNGWGESRTDETVTNILSGNTGFGSGSGRSGSRGRHRARTITHGRSKAFVTDHKEFTEESSRQFWSLEEEWERLVARVMNLDQRETLIKVFNRPTIDIATPDITHGRPRRRKKLRKSKAENTRLTQTSPALPTAKNDPEDFHE